MDPRTRPQPLPPPLPHPLPHPPAPRRPHRRPPAGRARAALVPLVVVLVFVLGGCVPGTRPGTAPEVAVLNAPLSEQVPGLAETLVAQAEDAGTPGFAFTRDLPLRFLEVRRNLDGSRAADNAARIARGFGADLALMVGAPLLEREILDDRGGRTVRVTVQAQVLLVDAATAEVVARVASPVLRGERREPATTPLPEVERDPTAADLLEQALAEALPEVLAAIRAALPGANN